MPDYIPRTDAEFSVWAHNFTTYVAANQDVLGLMPADVTPLTTADSAWSTVYADCTAKQNAAHAVVGVKCQNRDAYETLIRATARRFQASAVVSDSQRRDMGLTVKDDSPVIPTAAPASRPIAAIDSSQRLCHTIRFFDENTPRSRARPAGVMGCEIWSKIGTAPTDPGECQLLALDTSSPYVVEYDGSDAGKMAYYMLRWISTTGEKGHWSETVAATIAG